MFLSALIGSGSGASPTPESTDRPAFPSTLPASFSGTLPCANCAGIRHVLELYPDRTFVLHMSYLGKGAGGGDASVDDLGRWDLAPDGRRLTLGKGREGPMMFAVKGLDSLELLDRLGQPIRSTFNHTLTRDVAFQPGEPQLLMRGMDADVPSPSTPPLLLDRTRWGLIESQLAAPLPDAVRDRVRFDFSADQFSANSGCNTGTAGYRIDPDGTLQLPGVMATTRKACLPEAAAYEMAFFAFLASGPVFNREVNGDVLVLRGKAADPEAQGLLRLKSMPVPSAAARQKFIYVAAMKVPCMGAAPQECLQVRESPEAPWQLFYGGIIGFSYQPGIEYRLRILEDDVPNPPADGSSRRWYLDLIVEQKAVK